MVFGNQFHIPGSYHFEGPGAASALNANMFRPPVSPTASTYNLSKSTGSLLSDNSMANNSNAAVPKLGRKRTHDESTARAYSNSNNMAGACNSPMEYGTRGQHHYTLAGQIETPGAQAASNGGMLEDSLYSDIDYRRALGSKRPHEDEQAQALGLDGLVNAETGEPISPRAAGWTTFAFQAIGGVVGKVWEFCRGGAGAFRGFQAGGGKAYEVNGQPIPILAPGVQPASPQPSSGLQETPRSPPGAYPNAFESESVVEYIPNYFSENHNSTLDQDESVEETPDRPAAKRRQTGAQYENDELRRNWVMVDDDESSPAPLQSTSSPRRPAASATSSRIPAASRTTVASRLQQPRFSTPGAAARRISVPSPRLSAERSSIPTRAPSRLSMASTASPAGHAGSPSLNAREPASFASPRSPQQPASPNPFALTPTGSRIPQPRGLGPNPFANTRTASPTVPRVSPTRPSSRQSVNQSPLAKTFNSKIATTNGHRKSLSTTSIGSARGRHSLGGDDAPQTTNGSPRLDDEGRQLASKRFATQKRHDTRLDRLNAELQGLIRQGQEALGTTYDVDMDESWEEDA